MVFQRLEGENLTKVKEEHLKMIARDEDIYKQAVFDIINENPDLTSHPDREWVVKEINARTKEKFDNYVETTFQAHKKVSKLIIFFFISIGYYCNIILGSSRL